MLDQVLSSTICKIHWASKSMNDKLHDNSPFLNRNDRMYSNMTKHNLNIKYILM